LPNVEIVQAGSFLVYLTRLWISLFYALKAFRDSYLLMRPAQKCFWGFFFFGPSSMRSGNFEKNETHLFRALISSSETLLNIGANAGYYCCHALQAGLEVIALEPFPNNVDLLLKNIQANRWENKCRILPVAAGAASNVQNLYGGGTSASLIQGWAGANRDVRFSRWVPVIALDDVVNVSRLSSKLIILVDVEGAEKALLDGAKSFLARRPKPLWIVEISIDEHQPSGTSINPLLVATFQKFWDLNYSCITFDEHLATVTTQSIQQIALTGVNTLPAHNFLFFDPARKSEIFILLKNAFLKAGGRYESLN